MITIRPHQPTIRPIVYKDKFYQWELQSRKNIQNKIKYYFFGAGAPPEGNNNNNCSKIFKKLFTNEQIRKINDICKNNKISKKKLLFFNNNKLF